jgi:hypothetical protein
MTPLPAVGTIVRLIDSSGPPTLAVVVPDEYHSEGLKHSVMVFTRLLEGPVTNRSAARATGHGGWWIGNSTYRFEVVPDDQVPDEILALAGRCLLDPTFIPEIGE